MRLVLLALLVLATQADAQTTRALIVTGIAGEPRIAQQFQRDGAAMRDALVQRFGAQATLLNESTSPRSDKAGIAASIAKLAADSKAGDRVLIVLVGHGSAQGSVARFNVPGPDLTAPELALMLEEIKAPTTIVLATSASGAFMPALKGHTVISATRNAAESEEVVFPRFFADAISKDVADADKDGALSLHEAFDYAKREVARYYQQQNRLATEHAILSDTAGAQRFVLRRGGAVVANAELTALQQQIEALKARKASMSAADYDAQLETLMLELARKSRELRGSGKRQ